MDKEKFISKVLEIEEEYVREKGNRMQAVSKIVNLLDKEWDDDTKKDQTK